MQDSKGYIWFSTEAGLCKYDGHSLKIFDKKNGLPEGSTYAVYEYKNMIWMITSTNRILVCANDTLREPLFSKQYTRLVDNTFAITYRMDFIDKSTVLITSRTSSYALNIHTKQLKRFSTEKVPTNYLFYKTGDKMIPITDRAYYRAKNILITILHNGEKKQIEVNNNSANTYWRVETTRIGNYDFISCDNMVIRFDQNLNHEVIRFPHRILSLYRDKENGLWVGVHKNGVYYYPNVNDFSVYKHGLDNISVSGTCQDKENNVWCSSLEKGIYFCHNKNITDYSNIPALKNSPNFLKGLDEKLFASSNGSSLFEIDAQVKEHTFKVHPNFNSSDIITYKDGWLLVGNGMNYIIDKNFTNAQSIHAKIYGSTRLTRAPNGDLFGINYSEVQKINPQTLAAQSLPYISPGRSILCDSKGTVWMGSDIGIHKIDAENLAITYYKVTSPIPKIIEDSQGNVWFSTKGSGLLLKTDTSIFHMDKILQIPTDIFYDITEDKDKNIWIATNIGLVKLEKKNNGFQTYIYTTKHGLSSNVIHRVATNKKEVFISTPEGLSSFPLDVNLQNAVSPNIYVSHMTVNGSSINAAAKSYLFPYDYNSINITFDILTYKDLGNGKLLYKLTGRDKDFQQISGNTIVMDNLSPNQYQLEVYAINSDGIKSEKPVIISIEIEHPFWETAWFIILSSVTFCVLFYFFAKKSIDNIRKKEAAKTHINKMMAEYQLSALQAQMNPHFIFNAINSIQSYILRKDEQQAYDYLSKFSKLIRMVLNNSEEKILTLHQELETLDLYIQLEQLRFNNKFEYQLHISDEVDQHEVQVPAMLIQPYVENAIWHGLMNLDDMRKGILRIEITHEEDELKIIVEDNGVGRDFTKQEVKKRTHKSIGMQLGEKRLMMLNQLKDFENARVQVIDLYDEAGHANGTRIEIYLPFN